MQNLTRNRAVSIRAGVAFWSVAVLMRVQASAPPPAGAAQAGALIDFERQVKPIIELNCLECHSQDKRKGGLSLAVYADILDGGRSGAVVRPGSSATSLVTHRLTGGIGDQMPLDNLPLSDAELAIIRRWIDQGARPTPSAPPAP